MPAQSRKPLSDAQIQQRRAAAHRRWSKQSPTEGTRAAREKFLARFLTEVDEHTAKTGETLTPNERLRRAESAKKAYFIELGMKSAKARRERAGATA